MKGLCPLASGSKGNCVYYGTENTKVLFDCGISGKATKKKLEEIGVPIEEIDAVVISHEHGDHIRGLRILAYRMGIPVFANAETAKGIVKHYNACPKFKIFTTGESFLFRDLEIHPFSIPHDAADPVAFVVHHDKIKLGICTDLGFATTLVTQKLHHCDYLYLESNHEPSMVHRSTRHILYKQRVLGRGGHLSNEACGELLKQCYSPKLKHVHLAHLSSECNTHERALSVVRNCLSSEVEQPKIHIALQDEISQAVHF